MALPALEKMALLALEKMALPALEKMALLALEKMALLALEKMAGAGPGAGPRGEDDGLPALEEGGPCALACPGGDGLPALGDLLPRGRLACLPWRKVARAFLPALEDVLPALPALPALEEDGSLLFSFSFVCCCCLKKRTKQGASFLSPFSFFFFFFLFFFLCFLLASEGARGRCPPPARSSAQFLSPPLLSAAISLKGPRGSLVSGPVCGASRIRRQNSGGLAAAAPAREHRGRRVYEGRGSPSWASPRQGVAAVFGPAVAPGGSLASRPSSGASQRGRQNSGGLAAAAPAREHRGRRVYEGRGSPSWTSPRQWVAAVSGPLWPPAAPRCGSLVSRPSGFASQRGWQSSGAFSAAAPAREHRGRRVYEGGGRQAASPQVPLRPLWLGAARS
jgi:hypothetical protein